MKQQIDDYFKNILYIKKSKNLKPLNNGVIKIYDCPHTDYFYEVKINYKYYNRLVKLNNVFKTKKVDNIIELVEYIKNNDSAFSEVLKYHLSNELSKEIDKQIFENLLKLKDD